MSSDRLSSKQTLGVHTGSFLINGTTAIITHKEGNDEYCGRPRIQASSLYGMGSAQRENKNNMFPIREISLHKPVTTSINKTGKELQSLLGFGRAKLTKIDEGNGVLSSIFVKQIDDERRDTTILSKRKCEQSKRIYVNTLADLTIVSMRHTGTDALRKRFEGKIPRKDVKSVHLVISLPNGIHPVKHKEGSNTVPPEPVPIFEPEVDQTKLGLKFSCKTPRKPISTTDQEEKRFQTRKSKSRRRDSGNTVALPEKINKSRNRFPPEISSTLPNSFLTTLHKTPILLSYSHPLHKPVSSPPSPPSRYFSFVSVESRRNTQSKSEPPVNWVNGGKYRKALGALVSQAVIPSKNNVRTSLHCLKISRSKNSAKEKDCHPLQELSRLPKSKQKARDESKRIEKERHEARLEGLFGKQSKAEAKAQMGENAGVHTMCNIRIKNYEAGEYWSHEPRIKPSPPQGSEPIISSRVWRPTPSSVYQGSAVSDQDFLPLSDNPGTLLKKPAVNGSIRTQPRLELPHRQRSQVETHKGWLLPFTPGPLQERRKNPKMKLVLEGRLPGKHTTNSSLGI